MASIDIFMVFGELLCTVIMMFSHEYPLWERAFILAGSLFSAGVYFIMYLTGDNNNPVYNGIIGVIAFGVIFITYWHMFMEMWKIHKIRKSIKIERMTDVQKQKYEREKKAKAERKARRKLKPTVKPGESPEPD